MRTDVAHCRESVGIGREAHKVVRVTGAAFLGSTDDFFASLLPHPLLGQWTCMIHKVSEVSEAMM